MSADEVVVGRIGAAHGVRGWLKITSYTESASSIFDYRPWILKVVSASGRRDERLTLDPIEWQARPKGYVVRFREIDDRNAAEQLRGADVVVDGSCLPELEADEYYWRDLIGLTVRIENSESSGAEDGGAAILGQVVRIFATGANDVMVIRRTKGTVDDTANDVTDGSADDDEILIPCTKEIIVDVNFGEQTMVVSWEP